MHDLVEIDVGFDRFHAQVIADHCLDEGVSGELLMYDETRYELAMTGRVPNRFLVRADDEPIVRRVIADLYPDLVIGDGPATFSENRGRSTGTKLVGLLLLVMFAGPVLFGAFQLVKLMT